MNLLKAPFKERHRATRCVAILVMLRNPWIQQRTLDLMLKRTEARANNDTAKQKDIHKQVRRAVRADKAQWLENCLREGRWSDVDRLRRTRKPARDCMKNLAGEITSSEHKCDTLAEHYERIQWRVRPANLQDDRPALGPALPIDNEPFTAAEVEGTIRKLKDGKCAGEDSIPPEYFKALLGQVESLEEIRKFMSKCWLDGSTPRAWHQALVSAIYKKGPSELCENYRPISLLSLGYKIYAALIKGRLVKAGAEDRLSPTQFGFRSGFGTQDAINILRRRIETAWAQRSGELIVLSLDWKQAFDSINVDAMMVALERFGLNRQALTAVKEIYQDRNFMVRDGENLSERRRQSSGVSQGCPLSPFLFVMVLTVVLHDAESSLGIEDRRALQKQNLGHLEYADDTLIMGSSARSVERLLAAVWKAGAQIGMEMHPEKFQLLRVRSEGLVRKPDGTTIEDTDALTYLGTTVAADGRIGAELGRRLGLASADFRCLQKLWGHASIGITRKLEIYNAVVATKLMYSMATAWLSKAEVRRLDGVQNRHLRRIAGIKPSMVSRVSNQTVLQRTDQKPFSQMLLQQQLLLYGRIARQPESSPLRSATFCPGSLRPAADRYVRRQGRPRFEWASQLQQAAMRAAGGLFRMEEQVQNEAAWKNIVKDFIYPSCGHGRR